MRRAVLIAVVAAACSGRGPRAVGTQPSWRGTAQLRAASGPVAFAPSSEAVVRYNEPGGPPPRSALGDAVVAAVRDAAVRANTAVPVADARLFRACAELAEVVTEEGNVSYSIVEFALQRNGIIEPSPRLVVAWADLDSPQAIVEQFQPRIAEILAEGDTARIGVGAARRKPDGFGAVVFVLQGSGVTTAPIPRWLPAGERLSLDATIDARYRDPEVYVTRPGGTVENIEMRPERAGGFTTSIRCDDAPGKLQIEIAASGAQGATVLANFPVWCGTPPPATLTLKPSPDDAPVADPREAEHRILELVNRDREAAALPPLQWDDRVAGVARTYSEEMRRTKLVAHHSPTTGSAADRVRAAKIRTGVVLENLARAYGLGEAHHGLMNSPGHRANIMSGEATHVGVGISLGDLVAGRREIFVTQVFIRVPPKLDPEAAAEAIRKRLYAVRRVGTDPALALIAQDFADGLASGLGRDEAYAALRRRVTTLGTRYLRITEAIVPVSSLSQVDAESLLRGLQPDDIGVGVGQGPHPELGEHAIFVVVMLGTRLPGR